ncbi:hypothetical protein BOX15_Mlig026522g1 [Macrostomum lignano]|uniref:Uncharacterized protein n=1 Tax=Macrostomum lignano TaxID=282301 RepID=A0A267GYS1_9PLAT|nr:hypothetical protein BOX15_Mlig026522g1 [Macrostomum lignano]
MLIIGALSGAWLTSGAASAALVGLATGAGLGAGAQLAGSGAAGAAGAAAGAASAAAILGAAIGGDVSSAVAGGAASLPASWAVASPALMSGPLGWLLVGCSTDTAAAAAGSVSFDCWKPLVRDLSAEPSAGRLLRDLAADPRIAEVAVRAVGASPQIRLRNVWGEAFGLRLIELPGSRVAAHAEPLLE